MVFLKTKSIKTLLLVSSIALMFGHTNYAQNIDLIGKWKFKKGDSLQWSKTDYNDQAWKEIEIGKQWEDQGNQNYDGYGWYRKSIKIPSSLKPTVDKFGGLSLQLGSIDDSDETFFNGIKVGETGKMPPNFDGRYNETRQYFIPAKTISWNKENIIAVRVYDGGGGGGIYKGTFSITPSKNLDYVKVTYGFDDKDGIFLGTENAKILVTLDNKGSKFSGTLKCEINTDKYELLETKTQKVNVEKESNGTFIFQYKPTKPGFYRAIITLSEGSKTKDPLLVNFGYEPEKNIVQPDNQRDFKEYWDKARHELSKIEPQFKLIKKDSLSTTNKDIYLVEMYSLDNILIRGWYSVPKKTGKYPAVLEVQGYSTFMGPERGMDDFAVFNLNIRGHGNSKKDINPGFPGYLVSHLDDKTKYIYRGAYMDCIRAVDFLCSRPEVDTTRIAVEGGSQGGALSFATAALDHRIKACVPTIPFLSDFPNYFKIAPWPGNEFKDYVEKDKRGSWTDVFEVLSYIDIKNLAPWIKCPLLMAAGLQDEVCPPHINFAAYNNVKTEKQYYVYPYEGHSSPGEFYELRYQWLKDKLKAGN